MRFLKPAQVERIREQFGTPVFVYDQRQLEIAADSVLAFPAPCPLVARFAMKSLPNAAVLRLFCAKGLHIDASSGFEADRALIAGIDPVRIQITAQELPRDLKGLIQRGVLFNACSLRQLRHFGLLFPGSELSIRVNPGAGSGHNNRTNTGGRASSFGIWHEKLDAAFEIAREFDLRLTGLHTHIGSGGDPEVWKRCAKLILPIAERFPDLNRLSLGGGFKVARIEDETSADLNEIGAALQPSLSAFLATREADHFQLEIEPGSFLVANAGAILSEIIDIVDTGPEGYSFLKIDSGMTELIRPSMYGAQHPLSVIAHGPAAGHPARREAGANETEYVVVGHCCEAGDLLTTQPGDPECLSPRRMARAEIGDTLVIEGTGAYASAMSAKNYNSFPEAAEVLIDAAGEPHLIRRRQSLDQTMQNEVDLDPTRAGGKP